MLEMYPYMFGLELVQPVLDVLLRANLESQPVAVGASSINGETDVSIPTSDVKSIYEISPGFAEGKVQRDHVAKSTGFGAATNAFANFA